MPLTVIPGIQDSTLGFIAAAAVVFIVFVVGSRVVAGIMVAALQRRHMRSDMVVVGERVVTIVLIGIGVLLFTDAMTRLARYAPVIGIPGVT